MSVRSFFLCLHMLWFTLGVYASYVMATAGGHPPGIVFLPIVLGAWGLGHATLWLMRKMAERGAVVERDSGPQAKKYWPASILIVAILLGMVFCSGIFTGLAVVASMAYAQELNLRAGIPRVLMWLPFAIGFIGLLLRQTWSRFLIAGGALGAAGIYLFMIVSKFRYDNINLENLLFVVVIESVLVVVGVWALRSSQLRVFLGVSQTH